MSDTRPSWVAPYSVLKRYRHLGNATRVQPLARGFSSRKWLVSVSGGDFVLRCFPPSFSRERAGFVALVQQQAAEAGLAPRIAPNDVGDLTTVHDEHTFALARYVAG